MTRASRHDPGVPIAELARCWHLGVGMTNPAEQLSGAAKRCHGVATRLLRPSADRIALLPDYQVRYRPRCCSVGKRKQQLIAVRIVDLNHVVAPPRLEIGNRALDKFTTQFCKGGRRQLDEQAAPVSARGVFTENDLAFAAADLADLARAIAFMPTLLEAEHVDVELKRAVHIGDEKNRARVPPVSSL